MPRSLLFLATTTSLLLACGDKKEKEKAWWEKSDACPAGATIERDGSDVFCAKDGARHGRFESYTSNGPVALVSGAYKNGARDGTWTQRTAVGSVLGAFELVEGTGTVFVWRDDGSVETEAQYQGDVLTGRWIRYNAAAEQAVKLEEGLYDSGKPVGVWTFRDDAGQPVREVDYRAGEIWETRHFENGELARTELSTAAQAEANKRAVDPYEHARNAGILGALQHQGGAFASLGSFSSGLDEAAVYGGLLGDEIGDIQGGFGDGLKGTGPAGGGRGGGYGTSGAGGMRGRRASPPQILIGTATATGSLDKNVIRRYIRRKARVFRYCYEKELVVKPSLKGTIQLKLIISPSGSVLNATASGLGNKKVESCVAQKARRIQFPKPKDGNVVVRMPLTFRPGAAAVKTPAAKKPAVKGGAR